MRLGYSRVSTQDQTTSPQDDQLRRAGCKKIYSDTASGSKADRPGLDALLSESRPGDTVVVWKLDRLGRSLQHLVSVVNEFEQGGRKFVSLTENIDTSTASGKLFFGIFASLAEFEKTLIQERTRAGLSAARARGRVGGRPKGPHDIKRAQMAATLLADPKNSVTEICRVLGVSRATAYRLAQIGRESLSSQPPAVPTPADAPGKPIRAATATGKATSKAERGVPPQAALQSGRKPASSPRKPARTENRAKTNHQPAKGQKRNPKPTSTKRK